MAKSAIKELSKGIIQPKKKKIFRGIPTQGMVKDIATVSINEPLSRGRITDVATPPPIPPAPNVPQVGIAPQVPEVAPVAPLTPTQGAERSLQEAVAGFQGLPMQSQFDLALQQILFNQISPQVNAPTIQAGREVASDLVALPEALTDVQGFQQLNLNQARRLAQIEEAGLSNLLAGITGSLEQRRSRLEELAGFATDIMKEQISAQKEIELERQKQQEQTSKALEKRRTDAIQSFFDLRESIASEGIPLSAESGQKFLQELQITDNPEEILNNYMIAAFNNPDVVAAFKPKKTGRRSGGKKGGKKSIGLEEVSAPLENSDLESLARDFLMGNLDENDLEYELTLLGIEDIDAAIKLIKARADLLGAVFSKIGKEVPWLPF